MKNWTQCDPISNWGPHFTIINTKTNWFVLIFRKWLKRTRSAMLGLGVESFRIQCRGCWVCESVWEKWLEEHVNEVNFRKLLVLSVFFCSRQWLVGKLGREGWLENGDLWRRERSLGLYLRVPSPPTPDHVHISPKNVSEENLIVPFLQKKVLI